MVGSGRAGRVGLQIVMSLVAALFLIAATPSPSATPLDEVDPVPLALEEVAGDVSVDRFYSRKEGARPVSLLRPLFTARDSYFISLSDLKQLIGEEALNFYPDTGLININQLSRVEMAVDKPYYIKQSKTVPTPVYPTYVDGEVYVPLRLVLEEMGYGINAGEDGASLVVVPPKKERVVALKQMEVDSVSPYRDGRMATAMMDLAGDGLIGWGEKVPGGMGSMFHIRDDSRLDYGDRLALEAPQDYDEATKTAIAMDSRRIYLYNLQKGTITREDVPYRMRRARKVVLDGERFIFLTSEGIFTFHSGEKTLRKRAAGRIEKMDASADRIVFQRDGAVYVLEEDGGWLLPDSGEVDFQLAESILIVDNKERGLVHVYDLESRKIRMTSAYDRMRPHSIRLVSGRYLALGQGEHLQLMDCLSNTASDLDLVNIRPTMEGRKIDWFYNGNVARGYVHADGKKIGQCITVHP